MYHVVNPSLALLHAQTSPLCLCHELSSWNIFGWHESHYQSVLVRLHGDTRTSRRSTADCNKCHPPWFKRGYMFSYICFSLFSVRLSSAHFVRFCHGVFKGRSTAFYSKTLLVNVVNTWARTPRFCSSIVIPGPVREANLSQS